MKLLLTLVLITILAVVAVSLERPSYSLSPLGLSVITQIPIYHVPLAAKKDLLIYTDSSDSSTGNATLVINRRNSDGTYGHVANFTSNALTFTTNGKWIGNFDSDATSLFMIDDKGQIANLSTIFCFYGYFLSDDTFVGIYSLADNLTMMAFEYNAANNNWTGIPGTEIISSNVKLMGPVNSFYATDNHFVIVDTSNSDAYQIQIYQRQADRSLKLVDSVPLNITFDIGGVFFNDVDTLVYSFPFNSITGTDALGFVYIYTKINGKWNAQFFSADALGYRTPAFFGFNIIFADPKTLLISASNSDHPYDSKSYNGGKILLLERNEVGIWEPIADLGGSQGLFGSGMALNDQDLIVAALTGNVQGSGFPVTFYVTPRCFYQPPNITCKNEKFSECTDLAVEDIFTLNNPQCGKDITAAVNGFSLIGTNAVEARVSVTKSFLPAVYCNATVMCPFPTTPTAPVTPAKVSNAIGLQCELVFILISIFFVIFV